MKVLREHRLQIAENARAYEYDVEEQIERLIKSLIPHLRKAGYWRLSLKKHGALLSRIIGLLFGAQDNRPMFHVEGTELPLCWNAPKD